MKKQPFLNLGSVILCFFIFLSSCTKDYIEKPAPPKSKVGVKTDSLEASYVNSVITSVNAPYWKEADYLQINNIVDLSTANLYDEDGRLNLTGTYNGINDFNNGDSTSIILKAGYDDEYLYLYAEWKDAKVNSSQDDWLYDGPTDNLKPGESRNGWTSQRNDDKVALAFDVNDASTSAGMFTNVGCAASCHNSGGNPIMSPEMGKVDIWNWSLALSEPFGYALDMNADAGGLAYDSGQKSFERNAVDPNDYRSGPAYEWNGISQNLTQSLGNATILDPGFYLLNKTPFLGVASNGKVLYGDENSGCIGCHGPGGNGNGTHDNAPAFNTVEFSRKFSRDALSNYASSDAHTGSGYFISNTSSEIDSLVAYIRGLAGVPGYVLTEPVVGESINDISTHSNVTLPRIDPAASHSTYKVMFKRKLNTGNADDAVFDPNSGQSYVFGVALMDDDGKNHVGSLIQHLIFKAK